MAVRFSADGQDFTRTLTLGAQTAFTVCCWAYVIDRNDFATLWALDNGTGDMELLQTRADGLVLQYYPDYDAGDVTTLTAATWTFIAIAGATTGNTRTAYYRTASQSTLSTTSLGIGTSTNMATLRLGESAFGAEWLNGRLAAVKAYIGVTLTAAEIHQESMQYVPERSANLTFWYPWVKTETPDYSGNGQTLSGGAGATTEDGPPIPWRATSPRLILPAASSGTTASAEAPTATAVANDITAAIVATATEAPATGTAEQPTAIAAVVALAEASTGAATANDATEAVAPGADVASAAGAGIDATAAIAVSADAVTATAAAGDATVTTGSATTASAAEASASATAHDPTSAITVSGAEGAATGTVESPAAAVTASSTEATATATAETPAPAVTPSAAAAAGTGQAHDAAVATAGGATAAAQDAVATATAGDASGTVITPASVVTASAQALDATGLVVVLAAASAATGTASAHDSTVTIVLVVGEAQAMAGALDAFVPPQISRGQMSPVDRDQPTMTAGTGTASTMTPVARAGSTMKGV